MKVCPARVLRLHRQRREHRRRRRETIELYRLVVAAVERGYEQVIGYTDVKIAGQRRGKRS